MTDGGHWILTFRSADPGSSLPRLLDYLRKRDLPMTRLECNAVAQPADISLSIAGAPAWEADQLRKVVAQTIGVDGADLRRVRTRDRPTEARLSD